MRLASIAVCALALVACDGGQEVHLTLEVDPSITAEQLTMIRSLEISVFGGEPGDIRYPISDELNDRKTTWIYKSKVKTALQFLVAARGPSRLLIASGLSKPLTPGGSAVSDTVQLTATPPIPNKLRLGEACIAGVDVCASGFCVDGVCCDGACDGPCNTCSAGAVAGKCALSSVGTSPRNACPVDAMNPCGNDGTCDGAGTCRVGSLGKLCAPQHCEMGMFTTAATCDGQGHCATPEPRDCDPYDCNPSGTACATICTGMSTGCASGKSCTFGNCGLVGQGARCVASGDCASGPCVDGYCCDSPCLGPCVGCGVLGHEGTCISVPPGGSDPHQMCPDEGAASCGKNGRCDGAGACQLYPAGTPCALGGCSDDGTSFTAPGVCAGDGSACPTASPTSCAPYTCVMGGSNGAGCDQSCGECGWFEPGMGPPFQERCAGGLTCVDQCITMQRFVCQ
jgi:hypothetical protein